MDFSVPDPPPPTPAFLPTISNGKKPKSTKSRNLYMAISIAGAILVLVALVECGIKVLKKLKGEKFMSRSSLIPCSQVRSSPRSAIMLKWWSNWQGLKTPGGLLIYSKKLITSILWIYMVFVMGKVTFPVLILCLSSLAMAAWGTACLILSSGTGGHKLLLKLQRGFTIYIIALFSPLHTWAWVVQIF